ncbi:Extracellular protein [Seiridium cupressi]
MPSKTILLVVGFVAVAQVTALPYAPRPFEHSRQRFVKVEIGPRPEFLVNDMDEGWLKERLSSCLNMEMQPTKFSIGHRGGGCLQFPEETSQSITAGIRMGAGVQECDVAFTNDLELVCRHDQCDLHTTTNIVATELGSRCTQPFTPAANGTAATAKCCTSDITLAEFKSLCGKMDGFNASATTAEDFLHGTPAWRTELYATCGTVLSHKDFIELVNPLGLDFTPELKTPPAAVPMPFNGSFTQEKFAQRLADEYRESGIDFSRVWPQSFLFADLAYWIENEPVFAKQALLLDESGDTPDTFLTAIENLTFYKDSGVNLVAPPLPYLVTLDDQNEIVPSAYAVEAKRLGLEIITWSLERSGPIANVGKGPDYYYSTFYNGTNNDGDIYKLVDVLARRVGVKGIFSDWSSTVTYYANCFGFFP